MNIDRRLQRPIKREAAEQKHAKIYLRRAETPQLEDVEQINQALANTGQEPLTPEQILPTQHSVDLTE